MATIVITLLTSAVGVTDWTGAEHAELSREISSTNRQVALNVAMIAESRVRENQDREERTRFYAGIDSKVSHIIDLMIRREDKVDEKLADFMEKVVKRLHDDRSE